MFRVGVPGRVFPTAHGTSFLWSNEEMEGNYWLYGEIN